MPKPRGAEAYEPYQALRTSSGSGRATHPGMSSQPGMDTVEQSSPVRPTGQSQRCSCSLHVPYFVHSPAHTLLTATGAQPGP